MPKDEENWNSKAAQIAADEISKIDSCDVIPPVQMLQILKVLNERRRQDEKWGGNEHDDAHTTSEWVAIIAGELNEVLWGIAEGDQKQTEEELVHVAAVAVAWLEAIERRKG